MSVYLDLAFLINFLFDAELLWITHILCSEKIRPFRIFLAAFMGGLQGVVVFFPFFSALSLPPVNFLVSLIMVFTAVSPCKIGKFITFYTVFVSTSFFTAGLTVFMRAGVLMGFLLVLPCYFLIDKIKKELYLKRTTAVLYYGGKRVEKRALYDSGNSVTYMGRPVIFGNRELLGELLGEESLENCGNICFIPYKTPGKSGVAPGIRLDRAEVFGKSYDSAVLGFFDKSFGDEIILNGTMMEKG